MDMTAGRQARAHLARELNQPIALRNGMNSVEPQSVELKFMYPVKGVLDEEATNFRLTEIDCGTPGCRDVGAEKLRSAETNVITIRTKVVVHNVKKDHQREFVRAFDEYLQFERSAVGLGRSKGEDAVIAPISLTRKSSNGHQ